MRNKFSNVVAIPRDWSKPAGAPRQKTIDRQLKSGQTTPAHILELRSKMRMMTVNEVAELTSTSIWTVYQLIKDNELECQPMGRIKRVSSYALADYLEREFHKKK